MLVYVLAGQVFRRRSHSRCGERIESHMAASLHIAGIRKVFGKGDKAVEVLKNIDIDVAPGEFLILVGPSGCGKSTLLNIIAGLEEPTEGELAHRRQRRHRRGPGPARHRHGVPELRALPDHDRGRQHRLCAGDAQGAEGRARRKRIHEVAAMLQIEHLLDRRPAQLSGGQRQRVAMGRALARDPQLFLFDEPLSNLDAKLRVEMRAEIKRLHQRLRHHHRLCDARPDRGHDAGQPHRRDEGRRIEQLGTPEEIYDRPANMFVAEFIGSPSMNLFACERSGRRLARRRRRLPLNTRNARR